MFMAVRIRRPGCHQPVLPSWETGSCRGEHVPCDPKHEALSLVCLKLRIFSGCGSFRATKGQVPLLFLGPDFLPPSAGDDCHTKA